LFHILIEIRGKDRIIYLDNLLFKQSFEVHGLRGRVQWRVTGRYSSRKTPYPFKSAKCHSRTLGKAHQVL